ncbi:cell division protein ZapE [Congregibacter variabilis]|uniref:Cell division protein ZapE n=1 Tax=Congregibacter variabilis TaxID=3081200 RepID=A0ABZ0I899_9GAMM|nr:cell division protein ZapE [Congregibacter sp. IMCC43200]
MLTPWQRYQEDLKRDDFSHDAAQEAAVRRLQDLYDRVIDRHARSNSLAGRLSRRFRRSSQPERGLYFWGGVGRGKTYLMDAFYESLPFEKKLRVHFHRFMQRVHRELSDLEGEKNPIELLGQRLAEEAEIICFDEFFVSDIADAMILANFLQAIFQRGIALVATSNIAPEGLYENGLQRARFLPAIALLQEHTEVLTVDAGIDYRLRTLEQAELYHHPLGPAADASLTDSFQRLAPDSIQHWQRIEINGRYLTCRCLADDVAWFEFAELCDGPRSQNDYIELAREFHAVILSGVPKMTAAQDDQCRRFINLVDEFYDRSVKLVIAAEVPASELYSGTRLTFEFARTESRLFEMQSHDYLAQEHRP